MSLFYGLAARLTCGQWKVLILDEKTRRIVDGVVKHDDVLQENVTSEKTISHNEKICAKISETLSRSRRNETVARDWMPSIFCRLSLMWSTV